MEKKQLSVGQIVLLVALFVVLVIAVIWGSVMWEANSGAPMSGHGWTALVLGTVFSLVIGCGLMALMFYSSRSGHDIVATLPLEAYSQKTRAP